MNFPMPSSVKCSSYPIRGIVETAVRIGQFGRIANLQALSRYAAFNRLSDQHVRDVAAVHFKFREIRKERDHGSGATRNIERPPDTCDMRNWISPHALPSPQVSSIAAISGSQ